jgi:NADH-ubiquinone oxidoreductase chain 4
VLLTLLLVPTTGILIISSMKKFNDKLAKIAAQIVSVMNLFLSVLIFTLFDFSNNQYQFVQEHYNVNIFDLYLGVDGLSIYFVLLTTFIIPIALLSN